MRHSPTIIVVFSKDTKIYKQNQHEKIHFKNLTYFQWTKKTDKGNLLTMSKVLLKSIGKKIFDFRTLKNESQEEIAFKAGLNPSYLSQIEGGKRNVSAINLFKIAKALNREVGELFPSVDSICI